MIKQIKQLGKGKKVFIILLLLIIALDTYYILNNGNPFQEETFFSIMVGLSIIGILFILFVLITKYIIHNWND